jgi:hypothetical protein
LGQKKRPTWKSLGRTEGIQQGQEELKATWDNSLRGRESASKHQRSGSEPLRETIASINPKPIDDTGTPINVRRFDGSAAPESPEPPASHSAFCKLRAES